MHRKRNDDAVEQITAIMHLQFEHARRPRTDTEAQEFVDELLERIQEGVHAEDRIGWMSVYVWATMISRIALGQLGIGVAELGQPDPLGEPGPPERKPGGGWWHRESRR